MATFRVGQRVRIKWSLSWPELAGKTGTVIFVGEVFASNDPSGTACYRVAPDIWGSDSAPYAGIAGGNRFVARPDQLEPLTDDRNQVIPWSACCVGPDGVWREGVAA